VGSCAAGSLEWPAELVSLSSSKSLQSAPSSESAELQADNSASAQAEPAPELTSENSASAQAQDALDASQLSVALPLPLVLAARAGLRTVLTIAEPTSVQLGELVEHVPTAVSHQSQTIVHDHRRLVTPIVAPGVRTTQLVRQQSPWLWTLSAEPQSPSQTQPRLLLLRN
ncbi:retinin, partial [Drosophila busckii]